MHFAEYKGVLFIEAKVIAEITSDLNGAFSQNQLRPLDDLKEKMRSVVIQRGRELRSLFQIWSALNILEEPPWHGQCLLVCNWQNSKF